VGEKLTMKNSVKYKFLRVGMALCFVVFTQAITANTLESARGAEAVARQLLTNTTGQFNLYNQSHALLIGNMNYDFWPRLPKIKQELEGVSELLAEQGFQVHSVWDLNADQLRTTLRKFLHDHGAGQENSNNRLLIFYSGHGDTRKGLLGDEGYIIPTDSPQKKLDDIGFLDKALSMNDIVNWSTNVSTRHILFLFDSCFSGSILESYRSANKLPPHIHESIKNPVRQFITAGGANERVPSSSRFTPAFIRALKEQAADYVQDGFVTGTELALYLAQEVPKYTSPSNHPLEGKIGNGANREGDFVFSLRQADVPISSNTVNPIVNNIEIERLKIEQEKLRQDKVEQQEELKTERKEKSRVANLITKYEPKMIFVKGGDYRRSKSKYVSYEDKFVSDVYISQTEVTKGTQTFFSNLYALASADKCLSNCNIAESFSYSSAQTFISRLNEITGKKYRLPTEKEWEFACTARGNTKKFCGGNNLDSVGIYSGNREQQAPHNVALKKPNGLGLYDMTGNMSEIVSNCYKAPSFHNHPNECPDGLGMSKGGNLYNPEGREELGPFGRGNYNDQYSSLQGLRLVLDAE